jgi:hypothetical protein
VRAELDAQPKDIQARLLRIVELIEGHGLERVREPYVEAPPGPIWEMRMKGRDRSVRQEDREDARGEIESAVRRARELT